MHIIYLSLESVALGRHYSSYILLGFIKDGRLFIHMYMLEASMIGIQDPI